MKNTSSRTALKIGGAAALLSLPLWAFAQTPPVSTPAGAAPAPPPAAPPAAPPVPSTAEGGYLIGLKLGEQIHRTGIKDEVAVDDITRGLKDALAGKEMTRGDQEQLQVFVKATVDAITAKNRAAGKDYLEKNAKEKGVKTTASGLQYRVLIPGDLKAASPQPADTVTVQYRGMLTDGTEFDSSYERGKPQTFPMTGGVIKGFQEALTMMKSGSKWKIFLPPELGYDARPVGIIPAGSVLVFEVELQSITPPAAAASPAAPKPAPPLPPASK
jgi:FKBP-type peptidyl-prolyl cis-trans isomerase FklB